MTLDQSAHRHNNIQTTRYFQGCLIIIIIKTFLLNPEIHSRYSKRILESWMRPCGSIATVSNIWDPDQARRFVWSDLGPNLLAKIIILRASPLVSYRILGRGYCSTCLFAENK